MITYLVIGTIVTVVLFIEQVIRYPSYYDKTLRTEHKSWGFWKSWVLVFGICIIAWPIAIVWEIKNLTRTKQRVES